MPEVKFPQNTVFQKCESKLCVNAKKSHYREQAAIFSKLKTIICNQSGYVASEI